jgi:large subunit ribosomal protein L21
MSYAVIALQGKQYKVKEGQILTVDQVSYKVGESFEVKDVLLMGEGSKTKVGQPLVAGAKVEVKVVETGKDKKLRVFKYKSKSKYRKTIGHRQRISNLEIVKIT